MKTIVTKFTAVCLILVACLTISAVGFDADHSAMGSRFSQRTANVNLPSSNMISDLPRDYDGLTRDFSALA